MPPRASGILSSETFELIAQSGQKRFFVHGDILPAHLAPTHTTTAAGKQIDLSDWDADTVGRFIEFLYFAKYQVPEPTPEEKPEDGSGGGSPGSWSHDGISTPGTTQTTVRRGRKGRRLSGLSMLNTVQSLEAQGRSRVDVGVLLAHAKVYALAQYIDVEGLKIMALERFRTAIGEIEELMSRGLVGNLTGLLVYIYSHTDTLAGPEKPMQVLMSKFFVENPEKFMQDVTEKLRDAEKHKQAWRRLLERRRLKAAGKEVLEEDVQVPMTEGKNRRDRQTFSTLFILVVSVLAIMASLFVQDAPLPTAVEERSFKGICQYNKASWVGGPFIVVEGRPLKEACSGYIQNPLAQQSSTTAKEIMKDMCQFYESNSWVGSTIYSIRGKSLQEYCHGEGYTKEPARTKSSKKTPSSTMKPPRSTRSSRSLKPTSTKPSSSTKTSATTKPTSSPPTSSVTTALSAIITLLYYLAMPLFFLYECALGIYSCVSFFVGVFYYIFIIFLSPIIFILLIILPLRISFVLCMAILLFGNLFNIALWPLGILVGLLML